MVNQDLVRLIAKNGDEYKVSKEIACISPVLKASLDNEDNFMEENEYQVNLMNIESNILNKVVEYLEYKNKYQQEEDDEIPQFDIPVELSLELLLAADYLNI
ncbi:elongin C SCDLUD_001959 [Saccharomycodes ludwigii]|uniref:elongin C n=1 Tax=Saccharomycodes ludwigii TaxID=36035 RepID=UPI001E8BBD55|nr:hypothetical protein SCDLUD_001959 [Saccharomycodes ludwigii]KAH3902146.1 hypothetical protein SCDLUD_001959 [Saccharomycodes ludwigii]